MSNESKPAGGIFHDVATSVVVISFGFLGWTFGTKLGSVICTTITNAAFGGKDGSESNSSNAA